MTSGHTQIGRMRLRSVAAAPHVDSKPPHNNIRAVILLSGYVRPTELCAGLQRSVLDLPIDSKRSVLGVWADQATMLAQALGVKRLPVRILVNGRAARPSVRRSTMGGRINVRVELDAGEYRGTGGVLADLGAAYDDDDRIVVANGGQLVVESLTNAVLAMVEAGGDVSLISHRDGSPTGLMLIRCGVLRSISPVGFVDLKEQALPQIAASHKVTVVNRDRPIGLSTRRRADYLRALFQYHRRLANRDNVSDAFAEEWKPTFSIIEPGARVDPTARVHDSVVLRGGRVERGATLIHSIVCVGGVVRRKQMVTDRVIVGGGNRRRRTRK